MIWQPAMYTYNVLYLNLRLYNRNTKVFEFQILILRYGVYLFNIPLTEQFLLFLQFKKVSHSHYSLLTIFTSFAQY